MDQPTGVSPVLAGMQLTALEPVLKPSDQLRYGIGSPLPARPRRAASAREPLARVVPTAFWPAWSLGIVLPDCDQRQIRLGLSVAILLVKTKLTLAEAAKLIESPLNAQGVSRILRLLDHHEHWHGIREALTTTAGYLAESDVASIDYKRRRRIDYATLLPNNIWARICRDTGTAAGTPARANVARCFLFERLSGMPADMAPFASDTTHFRRAVADFPSYLTVDLTDALRGHADEFMQHRGISGEPLTWQPPTDFIDNLPLPGLKLGSVDTSTLTRVAAGKSRARRVASELDVSMDASSYLVETFPAPSPPWASGSAPRPVRTGAYCVAKAALPRDRLSDLYSGQRMSLRTIAAAVGVSKPVVARLAEEYGLELREPGPKVKHVFERDWLFEQYVSRHRTLPDIGAEVGVSIATVARWLVTFNIPIRGRGGASHSAALTAKTLSGEAPDILRPALTAAKGWSRLHRLASAVQYPTLTIAAKHIGTSQCVLAMQISRVERDLGKQLLVRAERGHPMKLTKAGEEVVSAFNAAAVSTTDLSAKDLAHNVIGTDVACQGDGTT